MKNMLSPNNCNKTMCKSCIFRTDGNALELDAERMEEIKKYLLGSSSHFCHVTNKTCYGGLTYQAIMFHRMGIIAQATVKCFLETAANYLKK